MKQVTDLFLFTFSRNIDNLFVLLIDPMMNENGAMNPMGQAELGNFERNGMANFYKI